MDFKDDAAPPLRQALQYVREVIDIALNYRNDADYMPTMEVLETLQLLERKLLDASDSVQYVREYLTNRLIDQTTGS